MEFTNIDFDCTVANPIVLFSILLAATVVVPLTLVVARTLLQRLRRAAKVATAVVLLAFAWFAEQVVAQALAFGGLKLSVMLTDHASGTTGVGCMTSSPWWLYQGLVLLASAGAASIIWLIVRHQTHSSSPW